MIQPKKKKYSASDNWEATTLFRSITKCIDTFGRNALLSCYRTHARFNTPHSSHRKKKTKSQTIYNLSVSNIPYYDSDLFSIF